jgi:ComF family protein
MSWFATLCREAAGLLELLLPESCPVCDHSAVLQPEGLCCECLRQLILLPASHCPSCSLPYPGFTDTPHLCGRCTQNAPAFAMVIAVGLYLGTLQSAINRFKNHPRPTLDRALGQLLAEAVEQQTFSRKPDLLVPVPLHKNRLRKRGFNQSRLLAEEIARHCRIPLDDKLLERIRPTPPQQGLPARLRLHNLRGALTATRRLDGEYVLLVDDVMTTGTTADACARALLNAGAGQVSVAVLARAGRNMETMSSTRNTDCLK